MIKVILGTDYDFYIINKYYSRSYTFYNPDEYHKKDISQSDLIDTISATFDNL